MLAERRRALRALGDRSLLGFWLSRLVERAGDWIFLLSLMVLAWSHEAGSSDAALAAWTLAIWLTPRLVVVGLFETWTRRLPPIAWPLLSVARAIAIAGALVAFAWQLLPVPELLLGTAGVVGFISAVAAESRSTALIARLDLVDLGSGTAVDGFVERAALFVGGLVAGAILLTTDPVVAPGAAVAALLLGALLAFRHVRGRPAPLPRPPAVVDDRDPLEARAAARRSAIYLVVAFTTGAMSAVLLVAVLPVAAPSAVGVAPLLVAAAGLGMLLGPLPVPRLLLRVPAPLLLFATVLLSSVVALVIVIWQTPVVALLALVVYGYSVANQDALRAIALRRILPTDLVDRIARLSLLALTVGQVYGAVGVVSIGERPDPFAILVLLAISQVLLVLLGLALGGRPSLQIGGLSSLPIKSVVHRLSWETRPAATPSSLAESDDKRARRLARWINRSVALQRLNVTLPVSGREYEIYRPDDESREKLFELGRADPEKQMPYWAKVWPSGVALADVVVERKEEVAGKHVLELGAGLGVTACAVLEYGGDIVTADYSDLPLAHCRLNTVVNTGKAPDATCFNWRHPSEVAAAAAQPQFHGGFPLIIAGDVLYEGRDAEPLLNVIDRLLVDDGSLWLAEPVRRTAQRFLDSAASLGWEIESRQVKAEWPDNTDGPVNLHFLTRSASVDSIATDAGGLRI
jgi:predicted nicotinamide N-methyase